MINCDSAQAERSLALAAPIRQQQQRQKQTTADSEKFLHRFLIGSLLGRQQGPPAAAERRRQREREVDKSRQQKYERRSHEALQESRSNHCQNYRQVLTLLD